MSNVYLDTNFFLYLSDTSSPFYASCIKLIKHYKEENILILTSAETIQEVIHYSKNIKQPAKGLEVSMRILDLIDELLPITRETIDIYLNKASVYKNASSRDLVHLSCCIENKIKQLVSFDHDFKKFKEIEVINPQELKI